MNPLKWLTGGARTQIRVAVDRSMTRKQRDDSRRATAAIKPKKKSKGGGSK